jgi:hypothetical protein
VASAQDLKRLLLWTALAATVSLFALLTLARSAEARPVAGGDPGSAFAGPVSSLLPHPAEDDEEDEGEEGETGDEIEANDCESDDEAAEEACEEREEAEEEKDLEEEELAEECRVEGAEATVTAVPARNQVLLTVEYRTFAPSAVSVELGLRGGKGPLDLGVEKAHFGRHGTLHATKTVSDADMSRVLVAKEFTVGVQAVNTPRFCGGLFERHLTAHHGSRWLDPTAARRQKEAERKR